MRENPDEGCERDRVGAEDRLEALDGGGRLPAEPQATTQPDQIGVKGARHLVVPGLQRRPQRQANAQQSRKRAQTLCPRLEIDRRSPSS